MLKREDIIGKRIMHIMGDTSQSDDGMNHCDFVYVLDGLNCFRMPFDQSPEPLFRLIDMKFNHGHLYWPPEKADHYQRVLWSATIVDLLMVADPEERYPDTGASELSSGWYVVQVSGLPEGLMPSVQVVDELLMNGPMVSIWAPD